MAGKLPNKKRKRRKKTAVTAHCPLAARCQQRSGNVGRTTTSSATPAATAMARATRRRTTVFCHQSLQDRLHIECVNNESMPTFSRKRHAPCIAFALLALAAGVCCTHLVEASVMDEAWTRSMGRRLNGSMDDANAAERPATCHSRFAGSTAIEEACGHLGEASCRAVHFCTWHEEDAYNSHASGCFEHLDWFSDGTFPARAYACDARMTDKLAASFLEPRIPWLAASVIYLRCWGIATLLLLVAGLT